MEGEGLVHTRGWKEPGNWFLASVFTILWPLVLFSVLKCSALKLELCSFDPGASRVVQKVSSELLFPLGSILFFFFVFLPLLLLKSFLETGDGLSSKWINVYLNLNSQIARQELLPHLYESQTWIMIIKKVDEMSRLCHKISSGLCFSLELSTVCLYLVPTGISS